MFQMLGVFSEFERAMIVERVKAGLVRARAKGTRFGRPNVSGAKVNAAKAELAKGTGIIKTAKLIGVGVGTVQRIKRDQSSVLEQESSVSSR
jgi:DNA invertase Pin-like site-specific DNA recombinase